MRINAANPLPHVTAKRGQVPLLLTGHHTGPAPAPEPNPQRAAGAGTGWVTGEQPPWGRRRIDPQPRGPGRWPLERLRQILEGLSPNRPLAGASRAQNAAQQNLGSTRGG